MNRHIPWSSSGNTDMATETLWASDDESSAGETDAFDIWGMFWRRKLVVITSVIIGMIAGFLYFYSATPYYQSTASVQIERKRPPIAYSGMQVDRYAAMAETMTHPIVMRSPRIASDAYENHGLDQCASLRGFKNPIGAILDHLNVEALQDGLGVYEVSFVGTDPQDTSKIVSAVLDSYRQSLEASHQNVGQEARELMTKGREELMTELSAKEEAYRQFRLSAPPMWLGDGEGANLHQQRQLAIEASRSELQLEINQLEAQLSTIRQSLKEGANIQGIFLMAAGAMPGSSATQPVAMVDQFEYQRQLYARQAGQQLVVRSQSTMMPLKIQQEELLTRYGKDHPRVRMVKRSISEAQKYMDRLADVDREFREEGRGDEDSNFQKKLREWRASVIRSYVGSLRQQLSDAREQFATLNKLYAAEEEKAKKLANFQITNETYRKDIERTQALFEKVVGSLGEINLTDDGQGYNFSVISPAGRGIKVAPSVRKTFAVSMMLSGLIGFGIAYLLERNDQSFRTPVEISRFLKLPVIGNVPVINIHDNDNDKAEGAAALDPVLCTVHAPRSPGAEAYRTVRTAILFDARGSDHRVIQVTSPRPGDGKSTLAANLAIALAQGGKETLLVDADFRRPTVHKVFGFSKKIGMAAVVQGAAEPSEALTRISSVPHLSVMACGQRPDNPSELLSSSEFLSSIEYLREQFEFVIIDTPPLLVVSDPRAVAASVDAVVLTMRINKEARPVARRASEIMRECGANVVGVVVNGLSNGRDKKERNIYFQHGAQTYGYNAYKYGYADGYGDDYEESTYDVSDHESGNPIH